MNDIKCTVVPNIHEACLKLDMDQVIASLSAGDSIDIYRCTAGEESSNAGFLKQHFNTRYDDTN